MKYNEDMQNICNCICSEFPKGNPYRPDLTNGNYALSDEFDALLRNAAHSVMKKQP